MQYILLILTCSFIIIGGHFKLAHFTPFHNELCTGNTKKLIENFDSHLRTERQNYWGKFCLLAINAIAGLTITAKFVIYVFIYVTNYERCQVKNLGLEAHILRKRKVKNVLTFTGEASAAIIGLVMILLHAVIKYSNEWTLFLPESQGIYNILCYQIVAICNLISSPDMMRFVFRLDI